MKRRDDSYSLADLVAQSYLAIDFLAQFIASEQSLPDTPMADFHAAWRSKNGLQPIGGKNEVLTPGPILGHMYVSLVLVQQELIDHLPSERFDSYDKDEWGQFQVATDGRLSRSKEWRNNGWRTADDLPLAYIIRRIRNSLAHGNFVVTKWFAFHFYDDRSFTKSDLESFEFHVLIDFDNLVLRFLPALVKKVGSGLSHNT